MLHRGEVIVAVVVRHGLHSSLCCVLRVQRAGVLDCR